MSGSRSTQAGVSDRDENEAAAKRVASVARFMSIMSLPGLQLNEPAEPPSPAPILHDIKENTEWRFEVAFGSKIEVKLLSGYAELFGTELALKQTYTFVGVKAAIYTWHGCQIEVDGECQVEYLAEETPMVSYANLHFALERTRDQAIVDGADGPRVLLLGPENAGKTSLAKLLTAYATKCDRQPLAVNLDTKEGMLSIPGSLTAASFSSIIDVEHGWGNSPTNGPSQVPVKLPLVYFYGKANPEESTHVYNPLVTRLGLSVLSRLQDDLEAKKAGCIIDTPGIISQGKGGYQAIQHIVSEFSVNILVILGSERLYSDMLRRYSGQKTGTGAPVAVIKLDKSGGCVDRDEGYMEKFRQSQVREYFFGDAKNTLSPHTQQLDFSQVTIFQIAETSALLTSLLPGGEAEDLSTPPIFEKVSPCPQMQNSILAIVRADPNESQENIRDGCVLGFIYVAEVDEKKKKMKILAPVSGRLPQQAMIWGSWPKGIAGLVD